METNLKENYLEKIEQIKDIINKYDLDFNKEDNKTIEEMEDNRKKGLEKLANIRKKYLFFHYLHF